MCDTCGGHRAPQKTKSSTLGPILAVGALGAAAVCAILYARHKKTSNPPT